MTDGTADWPGWLASWDRQQQHLLPDREERFAAMFDVAEAVAGAPRRVLDLAGGPGSITVRLLRRFPATEATLVDVDPALLAIAEGVLGGDARVQIVRRPGRPRLGQGDPSRWLRRGADRQLAALAPRGCAAPRLRRPGGPGPGGRCGLQRRPMAPDGADRMIEALERHAHQVQPALPEGERDWKDWWHAAAADPVLAPLVAERNKRFGGETHPPEFIPPLAWHTAAREAGFTEAGCVWRHGIGAIVAALR
jgi:hypothetical protein